MIVDELRQVTDVKGNVYHIDKIIGMGGQGAVLRLQEKDLAVKVLINNNDIIEDEKIYRTFEDNITDVIITKDEPDLCLCKPLIMLKAPMCGYIMHLISGLEPINKFIFDPNTDETIETLFKDTFGLKKRYEVLTELSRMMARLHSKGLVYADLSPNNVFFKNVSQFTKVWLIDCDNLRLSTEVKKAIFTPGYGAPEVVNNVSPNTIFSDCYSFAVLAFKVLTSIDPFTSLTNDEDSEDDWDASTTVSSKTDNNPLVLKKFILEDIEKDKLDKFSHYFTKEVLDLFKQTFSEEALLCPTLRPSMREWYEVLKTQKIRITKCPHCGQFYFAGEKSCPFCERKTERLPYCVINKISTSYEKEANKVFDEIGEDEHINQELKEQIIKNKTIDKIAFKLYDDQLIHDDIFNEISIYDIPKDCLLIKKEIGHYTGYNVSDFEMIIKDATGTRVCSSGSSFYITKSKTYIFIKMAKYNLLYAIGVYIDESSL